MNLQQAMQNYAVIVVAHILSSLSGSEKKRINNVILFGSIAQMRSSEESDVDIFFDTDAPKTFQTRLRSRINKIIDELKITPRALEFKIKKIDNEINVIVGKLDEWNDLQRSIASDGIILYGKYQPKTSSEELYVIFSWENLGKSKGAVLNKFYGYKIGKRRYPGLIEKIRGIKLGRGTIMVRSENRQIIIDVLEKYGIDYSMFEVWK